MAQKSCCGFTASWDWCLRTEWGGNLMWKVEGDSGIHQAFGTLVTKEFFPSSAEQCQTEAAVGSVRVPCTGGNKGENCSTLGKIPFCLHSVYRKLRLQRVFSPPCESPGVILSPPSHSPAFCKLGLCTEEYFAPYASEGVAVGERVRKSRVR